MRTRGDRRLLFTRPHPPQLDSQDYNILIRHIDEGQSRSDSIRVFFAAIARSLKEVNPNMIIDPNSAQTYQEPPKIGKSRPNSSARNHGVS